MSSPSHDAILRSASHLVGERGYRAVTVRQIASEVGVSAAMVMKLFLSREKLFAAAQPDESLLAEPNVPTSELGGALVFVCAFAANAACRGICHYSPSNRRSVRKRLVN